MVTALIVAGWVAATSAYAKSAAVSKDPAVLVLDTKPRVYTLEGTLVRVRGAPVDPQLTLHHVIIPDFV